MAQLDDLNQKLEAHEHYLNYIQTEYDKFEQLRGDMNDALLEAKFKGESNEQLENLIVRSKVFARVAQNLSIQLSWLKDEHLKLLAELRKQGAN